MIGYFKETKQRIKLVPDGYSGSDKAKMFLVTVFDSIPNHFRQRLQPIDTALTRIVEGLCRNLMVRVDGFVYEILDRGTFGICYTEFEPFMEQFFRPKNGEVVLDVGANVGKYSFPAAKAVGTGGLVVAFEPHPINYHVLVEGFKRNGLPNFVAFNVALSNFDGFAQMFLGINSGTHSLMVNHRKGVVKVAVKQLDTVVSEMGLKRVDWIKVDVEGSELEVLQGADNMISRFNPQMILEVWNANKAGVDAFLAKHHYRYAVVGLYLGNELGNCEYYYCEPENNCR
jgi:FkbM family methyltransferase